VSIESTWKLLTPVSTRAPLSRTNVAKRPLRRLGFLSNRKPNATLIERDLAAVAGGSHPDLRFKFYETTNAGLGAVAELLDGIAAECDAVLVGSAD